MPCLKCVLFCPHSVTLLLHSSPSPTLPFLHPQNTRSPDPHFSTCYPQLEKQIPIFNNSSRTPGSSRERRKEKVTATRGTGGEATLNREKHFPYFSC